MDTDFVLFGGYDYAAIMVEYILEELIKNYKNNTLESIIVQKIKNILGRDEINNINNLNCIRMHIFDMVDIFTQEDKETIKKE
jgi:hypothetical protein